MYRHLTERTGKTWWAAPGGVEAGYSCIEAVVVSFGRSVGRSAVRGEEILPRLEVGSHDLACRSTNPNHLPSHPREMSRFCISASFPSFPLSVDSPSSPIRPSTLSDFLLTYTHFMTMSSVHVDTSAIFLALSYRAFAPVVQMRDEAKKPVDDAEDHYPCLYLIVKLVRLDALGHVDSATLEPRRYGIALPTFNQYEMNPCQIRKKRPSEAPSTPTTSSFTTYNVLECIDVSTTNVTIFYRTGIRPGATASISSENVTLKK
ncbi:hypothetical protein SODALDRAFT_382445 [Sodiomyces alkalinus F11]|uniref:Uncharacterized protein n=1 Tax=Sodiomyces alkalinus (strain CBS 110278 / VKM F-3762 / F11) TaxID=1314773 RepID=A0A3N2PJM7_SODAK|nr:hypothetical protein SODALDRAFT_382445 [Sodiomyces alkalinus F11]ROT34516.1 hypothetical protein SODALDRAFT_382445 [Sodiomyces alkalinus F11]